jgi:hypothetical protein
MSAGGAQVDPEGREDVSGDCQPPARV